MAKKDTSRVSVRAFEKVMKDTEQKDAVVEWNGLEIQIKNTLSFQETLEFVNNVVESCFDSNTGRYLPEVKLFMVKMFAIASYTNIALPKNLEDRYKFVYHTEIFRVVLANINKEQFDEICDAIDDKLYYRTNTKIDEIERQLVDLSLGIDDLKKKAADLFSGIQKEDIENVLSAIAGGRLDEEKLMIAYFKNKNAEEKKEVTET